MYKFKLCSNCFRNEGLKLTAELIGIPRKSKCKHCNSRTGKKLTNKLIENLCGIFFVNGSIKKCEYGGFPAIQMNNYNHDPIDISKYLESDLKLIRENSNLRLFYYGPRFWMFGEIEPLKELVKNNKPTYFEIIEKYPTIILNENDTIYRVRKNPKESNDINEYDSPPKNLSGNGRLDSKELPILYASNDIELCIHECRVASEDDLYFAKLKPLKELKLLNLSTLIEEDSSEFESLDLAIHFIFLAKEHSYNICRNIAKTAYKLKYDGIIYPSYFSYLKNGQRPFETVYGISIRKIPQLKDYSNSQIISNIALFGRPIEDKKVGVECINKIIINRIKYDITYGPDSNKAFEN